MRNEPLVRLAVFTTEFEASLARGALQAIGIPCLAPSESRGSFHNSYGGATANQAELMVFESDRVRALAELRRMQMQVVGGRASDEPG